LPLAGVLTGPWILALSRILPRILSLASALAVPLGYLLALAGLRYCLAASLELGKSLAESLLGGHILAGLAQCL
jgi:hypothetical protein